MKLSLAEIHALNTGKADKALVEKAKSLEGEAVKEPTKAEKPKSAKK